MIKVAAALFITIDKDDQQRRQQTGRTGIGRFGIRRSVPRGSRPTTVCGGIHIGMPIACPPSYAPNAAGEKAHHIGATRARIEPLTNKRRDVKGAAHISCVKAGYRNVAEGTIKSPTAITRPPPIARRANITRPPKDSLPASKPLEGRPTQTRLRPRFSTAGHPRQRAGVTDERQKRRAEQVLL